MTLSRSIEILQDLIAFPTVSTDSNLAMISYLAERLETLGARCEITHDQSGQKANLFATLGPENTGGILLSGHTDVVPVADQDWSSDPFDMLARDGLLFGRGTCDMKGFIAATLAMTESLENARLNHPLHFAFTHDEETGCLGARALVDFLTARTIVPDIAIVGEPTEMRIIDGHKGCFEYTTRFVGLEGHGSAPDAGVNAAEYAARYVVKLIELKEDLKCRAPVENAFEPPWTTINIGCVVGGVAHNVIPGKAEVSWEMRPVQIKDADYVKSALSKYVHDQLLPEMQAVYADASVTMETIGEVIGLKPMSRNAARDLVAELTGTNGTELVAFGTEAGLFQSLGTNVVVCGPGSIQQAHKPDEYLSTAQLNLCCVMLEKLGQRLTA